VEFRGDIADFIADDFANPAKLFVAIGVGALSFKDHVAAFEHGAFRNEHNRVLAGILAAVRDEQFSKMFNIEFVFGNHAAIGSASHGGKHGGEASVAAKNFQHHESLVRTGGSAQAVYHLNRARHTSAEADAIVGARNIVVHGLGNANDLEAFFVQ